MTEGPLILVVDDEKIVRESLCHWFTEDGYRVEMAENAGEALAKFQEKPWDVLLIDIKMPGTDGLELQRRLKAIDPEVAIVIMTAYATVDTAVRALKEGAYDYIVKPFDPEEIEKAVKGAADRRRLVRENTRLKRIIDTLSEESIDEIVGETLQIEQVKEMIRIVADVDTTVVITGESGTGKELVAKAIHGGSSRRTMPLISVNCAGLPESLIESELFGHEKGAFTGAGFLRKGKFELAEGGTIFLDEISDISPKTQIDLLRVLEERSFTRLGGTQPIHADFRVVVATNRNLQKLVDEKKFRADLYFRLNVFTIALPPLRERPSDIPLLARHFLEKTVLAMGRPNCHISQEGLDYMANYDWPGNVRELKNAIERGVLIQKGNEIQADDLPIRVSDTMGPPDSLSLEEAETRHIQRVLDKTKGNVAQAAHALQIDRVTLYNKIKKHGLRRHGGKSSK